jgi:hypothetical protein
VQLAKVIRMMRFVDVPENLKKVQLGAIGCNEQKCTEQLGNYAETQNLSFTIHSKAKNVENCVFTGIKAQKGTFITFAKKNVKT